MSEYVKSFLKFPGNKYRVLDKLLPLFPPGNRFIEPFVGSGVVFVNTEYNEYVIGDVNKDLMSLYYYISKLQDGSEFDNFLDRLNLLFSCGNNEGHYNKIREAFNSSDYNRHEQFIYLNRHGFNGLCRYNKNGKFNVAFGQYKHVYFPDKELTFYNEKLKQVNEFKWGNFQGCFNGTGVGDVVYCDPPYVPLNKTGFTNYFGNQFVMSDQKALVDCAISARNRGAVVLISNHDLEATRELYKDATKIVSFPVRRSISVKKETRGEVLELVAIY